jgi:membrane-associated phospholipid phosphatase
MGHAGLVTESARGHPGTGGVDRRRPTRSLARVAGFGLASAAVYAGLIATSFGQWLDAGSFGALSLLNGPLGDAAATFRIAGVVGLGIVALVAGLVALLRRRWRAVLQAVAILVLSAAGSEALKRVLPRPELGGNGYAGNTFPSGHMAIALALAVAVAVMLPVRRWARPASAAAIVVAAGVGCASIVSYAHRPSDVLGAVLVVGTIASCVLWRRPSAARGRPVLLTATAAGVLVGASSVLGGVLLGGVRLGGATTLAEPVEAFGWLELCAAVVGLTIAAAPEMRSGIRDPVDAPSITSESGAILTGPAADPVRRRLPRPVRSAGPGAGPPPD